MPIRDQASQWPRFSRGFAGDTQLGCCVELDVIWSRAARNDLYSVYDWIAGQANAETAFPYIARIEGFASKLSNFPNRGTPRFGISAGLRSVTFERRFIVTYRVETDCVWIVRLIDTARDFRRAFGSTNG